MECGKNINDDDMMDTTRLIAYSLDHRYKGKLLSLQKYKVTMKILLILKSNDKTTKSDYSYFLDYSQSKAEFANQNVEALSPNEYWKSFLSLTPKLAEMALLYVSLPSTVPKTSDLKQFFSSVETSEKALFVRNMLMLKK